MNGKMTSLRMTMSLKMTTPTVFMLHWAGVSVSVSVSVSVLCLFLCL
jgi:hypothetical protein